MSSPPPSNSYHCHCQLCMAVPVVPSGGYPPLPRDYSQPPVRFAYQPGDQTPFSPQPSQVPVIPNGGHPPVLRFDSQPPARFAYQPGNQVLLNSAPFQVPFTPNGGYPPALTVDSQPPVRFTYQPSNQMSLNPLPVQAPFRDIYHNQPAFPPSRGPSNVNYPAYHPAPELQAHVIERAEVIPHPATPVESGTVQSISYGEKYKEEVERAQYAWAAYAPRKKQRNRKPWRPKERDRSRPCSFWRHQAPGPDEDGGNGSPRRVVPNANIDDRVSAKTSQVDAIIEGGDQSTPRRDVRSHHLGPPLLAMREAGSQGSPHHAAGNAAENIHAHLDGKVVDREEIPSSVCSFPSFISSSHAMPCHLTILFCFDRTPQLRRRRILMEASKLTWRRSRSLKKIKIGTLMAVANLVRLPHVLVTFCSVLSMQCSQT